MRVSESANLSYLTKNHYLQYTVFPLKLRGRSVLMLIVSESKLSLLGLMIRDV